MSRAIEVSPKHGVNPSMSQCFYCMGDKPEIVLTGCLPGDAAAPRKAVWNMEPCSTCKGYMEEGIILISVKDGEGGNENPYRSGNFVVVRAEAFLPQITDEKLREHIEVRRVCFIEDSHWLAMGLPTAEG